VALAEGVAVGAADGAEAAEAWPKMAFLIVSKRLMA
jgi:hypothetical protein